MTAWPGFLIKEMKTGEDYDKAVQYAEALGVLRKEFRSKGWFFVTRMDQMGVYFKNQAQRRREAQAAIEAERNGGSSGGARQ